MPNAMVATMIRPSSIGGKRSLMGRAQPGARARVNRASAGQPWPLSQAGGSRRLLARQANQDDAALRVVTRQPDLTTVARFPWHDAVKDIGAGQKPAGNKTARRLELERWVMSPWVLGSISRWRFRGQWPCAHIREQLDKHEPSCGIRTETCPIYAIHNGSIKWRTQTDFQALARNCSVRVWSRPLGGPDTAKSSSPGTPILIRQISTLRLFGFIRVEFTNAAALSPAHQRRGPDHPSTQSRRDPNCQTMRAARTREI